MDIAILPDADAVALRAAALIAEMARAAVAARGRFIMAISGGHTPWQMLHALATQDVPWDRVQVAQVDERIAPPGDPDRNLTHLRASLLQHAPLPADQIHAMPVEASNLEVAAQEYVRAGRFQRTSVRLGRGTLDHQGRHRRSRAGARSLHRALRALHVAR